MLVIPVYKMLLIPDVTVYYKKEQLLRNTGNKGVAVGQKIVLILAKNNVNPDELTEDDFYTIGMSGVVTQISSQGYVVIRTHYRVNLEIISISRDHSIDLTLTRRNETEDLNEAVESVKLKNLVKEIRAFASGFQWADMAEEYLSQLNSVGEAAAGLSPWLNLSNEEYYAILAEDSVAKRTEMLEKALYDFLEVGRITHEAVSSQQEEQQKLYRESAIKRQMKHLQRELDEMHPENITDIRKFEVSDL